LKFLVIVHGTEIFNKTANILSEIGAVGMDSQVNSYFSENFCNSFKYRSSSYFSTILILAPYCAHFYNMIMVVLMQIVVPQRRIEVRLRIVV